MRAALCAIGVMVLCLFGAATASAADDAFWGVIVPSSNGDVHLLSSADLHRFGFVPDVGDPGPVVTTPDGQVAYVATCNSKHGEHASVTPIEVDAPVKLTPIDIGDLATCTTGLAMSPVHNSPSGGPMLYAVESSDGVGDIVAIDTNFNTFQWRRHLDDWQPVDVTVSPDGNTLYVLETQQRTDCLHCPPGYWSRVEQFDNTVSPAVSKGAIALNTSPAGHVKPVQMILSPDGTTNYVISNSCTDELCDFTNLWAVPTAEAVGATDHAFSVSMASLGQMTITPDGNSVYIAEGDFFGDTVAAIDVGGGWGTFTETDVSFAPLDPNALAARPDGKRIITGLGATLESADLVEQIDTAANQLTGDQATVDSPQFVAIVPDQAATAGLSVTPAAPGSPTTLNASGSSVFCRLAQCSKIRDYTWDFGDGTPGETTTDPQVTHVYADAGSYTATVTATTTAGTSTTSISNGHMLLRNGSPGAQTSQTFVIAQANPTLTGRASNDIRIGGTLHDTATLSGGDAPTGDVVFRAFGPDDPDCSRAPAFTDTASANGNGNVVSRAFTPMTSGRYRWIVDYVGDVNNEDEILGCDSAGQQAQVSAVQPLISGRASPHIEVGGRLIDSATLLVGLHPTGSMTFRLYGPDDPQCLGSPLATSVAPVPPVGIDALSSPFIPTVAGLYRWTADYSGDGDNDPAATACDAAGQQVQVTLVPPPPPPPPPPVVPSASLTLPSIGRILPTSGPTAGGGIVEIFGDSFADGASVTFGDVPSPSVTVDSYDHLAAIVPPHTAGTVGVFVTTPAGTSELVRAADYTYADPPPATGAESSSSSSPGTSGGTSAAPTCTVPRLTGLTAVAAEKRIRAAGCGVGTRRTRASHQRPGHVLAQSPRVGAKVAEGRKVSFTLSRVPRPSRKRSAS